MRPKSPDVHVARVRSASGSRMTVDSRLMEVIVLTLGGIVGGVHVGQREGSDSMDLDDRLAAGHGVVRMIRGNAREGIARVGLEARLRELLTHPGEERPLDDRHVLDRRMRVRRDPVAVRHAKANRELVSLARVTLQHRHLGAFGEDRRGGTPLDVVGGADGREQGEQWRLRRAAAARVSRARGNGNDRDTEEWQGEGTSAHGGFSVYRWTARAPLERGDRIRMARPRYIVESTGIFTFGTEDFEPRVRGRSRSRVPRPTPRAGFAT